MKFHWAPNTKDRWDLAGLWVFAPWPVRMVGQAPRSPVRQPRTSAPGTLGFGHRCVRGKAEVLIAPMHSVVDPVEVVILDTDPDPQLHNIGSAPLLAPIDGRANIFRVGRSIRGVHQPPHNHDLRPTLEGYGESH